MKNSITENIKTFIARSERFGIKDIENQKIWRSTQNIAKLCRISPKEAVIFSYAYFFTLTEESFRPKDISREISDDPFMVSEVIRILTDFEARGIITPESRTRVHRYYSISNDIIKQITNNENPFEGRDKKEKDFFQVADDLLEMILSRRNHFMSDNKYKCFDIFIADNIDFLIVKYLTDKQIARDEWPIFLYTFAYHYNGSPNVRLNDCIRNIYEGPRERYDISNKFREQKSDLFTNKLIEYAGGNFQSNGKIQITEDVMKTMLGEHFPIIKANMSKTDFSQGFVTPEQITERQLYYNDDEGEQIKVLSDLIAPEKLQTVQEQLKNEGYREGVCILLHGVPGTGKTESVLQIAKASNRPIMQVDMSSIRDKFVGESEKNVAEIFRKYNEVCSTSDVLPILLLNEADALLNKRIQVQRSTDQMNNTMQNILLEEMENFKGILFATTNLADNLDTAFERRFLFKICFKNPSLEARLAIWKHHFPELKKKELKTISEKYTFSGGKIENVVKKVKLNNILYGKKTKLSEIIQLCEDENSLSTDARPQMKKIGFMQTEKRA